MFRDNKDFYPTPEAIINKMLFNIDFRMIGSILEPSAGSGNIVEALKRKEKFYREKSPLDIDCIEADANLQHILKGKDFRVVYNDFLTYDTMKEYDLIVMNPPFSNGCKHLLKALEMQQRNGGAIVCLLNAETIKNPCTNDRQFLQRKLTEYNAKIEYIQDAFLDAERKTGVEIALIKVQLPEVQNHSFIFDRLKKAQEERETNTYINDGQLVENNFLEAIVNQYKMEVEAGKKLIREYEAMKPFILSEFAKDKETGETIQQGGCILKLDLSNNRDSYRSTLSINGFIKEVRGKYWNALFENPKFIGQLTGNLQREYYNKIEDLKNYDFSLYNIYELKIDMNKKVVKGVEDTIISLFEELSNKYHYYDEMSKNIHYYNGWKTNKAYIINKKVIIPLNAWDSIWGSFRYKGVMGKLQDMEKCFNYLDGGLTETVDLVQSLQFAEEYGETKDIVLKYFTVSFYKKGTCHIIFTNEELLKKFNIFGAQHKGWLPPCYGKKAYSDMTTEEKAVVNDFEGETEYEKVMNNRKYYLFDGNNLNLLEDKTISGRKVDFFIRTFYNEYMEIIP